MKTIARASIVQNFQDDSDDWVIHSVPVDAWYVTANTGGDMPVIGNCEGVSLSFIDGDRNYSIILSDTIIEWLANEHDAGRKRYSSNSSNANE